MLNYLERSLSTKERNEVGRYMSQLNNMEAIIKSRRMEIEPTITAALKGDPVQESNNSPSEAFQYLEDAMKIDEMEVVKRRLSYAYNKVKPLHRLIWDEHFINGTRDYQIYYDHDNDITKRTYYREKDELVMVVAGCLGELL